MAKRVQHALMRRDDETTTKVSKSIVLSAWLYLSHITLHLAMTVISETNMRMLFLMRSTLTENVSQEWKKCSASYLAFFSYHIAPKKKTGETKDVGNVVPFHSIVFVAIVTALPSSKWIFSVSISVDGGRSIVPFGSPPHCTICSDCSDWSVDCNEQISTDSSVADNVAATHTAPRRPISAGVCNMHVWNSVWASACIWCDNYAVAMCPLSSVCHC